MHRKLLQINSESTNNPIKKWVKYLNGHLTEVLQSFSPNSLPRSNHEKTRDKPWLRVHSTTYLTRTVLDTVKNHKKTRNV